MKINRRNHLKLMASTIISSPFLALSDNSSNNCEIPDDYVFTRITLSSGHAFYFDFFDKMTLAELKKFPPTVSIHKADYVFCSIMVDDRAVDACLKARWENVSQEELDGRSLFKIVEKGGAAGFSGDVKFQQKRIIKEYGRGNL